MAVEKLTLEAMERKITNNDWANHIKKVIAEAWDKEEHLVNAIEKIIVSIGASLFLFCMFFFLCMFFMNY